MRIATQQEPSCGASSAPPESLPSPASMPSISVRLRPQTSSGWRAAMSSKGQLRSRRIPVSLLRWRDGYPDKTMTDDDPVNSTRAERDAGDDPVCTRVDTEDGRVDRRAISRDDAFGRYPDGA